MVLTTPGEGWAKGKRESSMQQEHRATGRPPPTCGNQCGHLERYDLDLKGSKSQLQKRSWKQHFPVLVTEVWHFCLILRAFVLHWLFLG